MPLGRLTAVELEDRFAEIQRRYREDRDDPNLARDIQQFKEDAFAEYLTDKDQFYGARQPSWDRFFSSFVDQNDSPTTVVSDLFQRGQQEDEVIRDRAVIRDLTEFEGLIYDKYQPVIDQQTANVGQPTDRVAADTYRTILGLSEDIPDVNYSPYYPSAQILDFESRRLGREEGIFEPIGDLAVLTDPPGYAEARAQFEALNIEAPYTQYAPKYLSKEDVYTIATIYQTDPANQEMDFAQLCQKAESDYYDWITSAACAAEPGAAGDCAEHYSSFSSISATDFLMSRPFLFSSEQRVTDAESDFLAVTAQDDRRGTALSGLLQVARKFDPNVNALDVAALYKKFEALRTDDNPSASIMLVANCLLLDKPCTKAELLMVINSINLH